MANSPRWCNASVDCRLEWRPSRWVGGALLLLAALSPFAVLASGLPRAAAWPLAATALGYGVLGAMRYRRQPARQLVIGGHGGEPSLDGLPLRQARLRWRGPLAFLSWRDGRGRIRRLHWWPDTLPAARRRELRLAAAALADDRPASAMAP